MDMAQEKGLPSNVKAVHLLGGAAILGFILIWLMSGMGAVGQLVAYGYPAWQTLKALKSEDKDDDTFWLCYWLIYGWVQVIESVTDKFFFWIPMYETLKIAMYVFMWSPYTKGAFRFYKIVLEPLVDRMEEAEKAFK